jgi:radical SAM protein with 4Fe4S-binding SPASM domain
MKPGTFKRIIDEVKDTTFYIQLFLQGEPYINKELPEMIRYAHENKIYVVISSNGLLINKNNISRLLEDAPDKLIFSMDGTDEETYRMYRVGGDFNKAMENLKLLVEEKRKLNLSKPYIELQFLVMKQNEHQIEHVKKMAKNLGVNQLTLKSMQVYSFESALKFLPENRKYSRYEIKDGRLIIKNKLKNKCFALWRTAVITWDLKLIPCCYDKDAAFELGSLNDNTFAGIWKSEKYQAFRHQILKNRKSIDICTNCTEGM